MESLRPDGQKRTWEICPWHSGHPPLGALRRIDLGDDLPRLEASSSDRSKVPPTFVCSRPVRALRVYTHTESSSAPGRRAGGALSSADRSRTYPPLWCVDNRRFQRPEGQQVPDPSSS